MKLRNLLFGAGVLLVCFVGYIVWTNESSKSDFSRLFVKNNQSNLKSITFQGQKRLVKVTDADTLAALENAMRNNQSTYTLMGLTYEAKFEFISGTNIATEIFVHSDRSGISISNPVVSSAGDSQIITLRFALPVDEKLLNLMNSLMPSK